MIGATGLGANGLHAYQLAAECGAADAEDPRGNGFFLPAGSERAAPGQPTDERAAQDPGPFADGFRAHDDRSRTVAHAESIGRFHDSEPGRYESEIAFTDTHVGILLDYLRARPESFDNTIVVVTAGQGAELPGIRKPNRGQLGQGVRAVGADHRLTQSPAYSPTITMLSTIQ